MALMDHLWDQHQFLMHQFFSLPFAFLFYFLSKWGYLSLRHRYLYVSAAGCILALVTMGAYSLLLFTSAFILILLVNSVDHSCIHTWVFGIQMFWQTFWHLLIHYKESYLCEHVSIRLFLAVSALMLLTQRMTSVSMDLQERKLTLPSHTWFHRHTCVIPLPLLSYICNFTTLLGGPLCSYGRFVSFMEGLHLNPPPNPLAVVSLKFSEMLLLEGVRYGLVYLLRHHVYDPSSSTLLCGVLWVWGLAVVLRIQYYSHWKISECLNNAAGLGFWENLSGNPPKWSGLSDGDFWTTEASSHISEFARRWNATTASWLRRLVYVRSNHVPLVMTFGFSLWWHGLHVGHFVGFVIWAAAVNADTQIHRYWFPKLSSTQSKLLYVCLSWINTQMIITCVVIATELRNMSALQCLAETYIGLVPLCNIALLIVMKLAWRMRTVVSADVSVCSG